MLNLFLLVVALVLVVILTPIIFMVQIVRVYFRAESVSNYLLTVAIGLDQLGGSVLYERPDWTVSSYTYYLHSKNNKYATMFMKLIDLLFGKDHCLNSFISENKDNGLL